MAKAKRKPFDPAADLERRLRARAVEDARMRGQGIDPKIARWGDDALDDSRAEALERQGYEIVMQNTEAAADKSRSTVVLDQRGRVVRTHKVDIWGELLGRNRLTQAQHNSIRALQELMLVRAGLAGRGEANAYADTRVEESGDACAVTQRMIDAGRRIDATLLLVGPPSSRLLQALLEPRLETATSVRLVRRCVELGARPVFRSKDGTKTGLGRARPACSALSPIEARHCHDCGAELQREPADKQPTRGLFGVEIITGEEDWRTIVARVTGERRPDSQAVPLRIAAQALVDVEDDVERLISRRAERAREGVEALLSA